MRLIPAMAWLVSLAILVTFELIPAYRTTGPNLLANASFDNATLHWETSAGVSVKAGRAVLDNPREQGSQILWQTIPRPDGDAVFVSATLTTANVIQGPKPWSNARMVLAGRNPAGEWVWGFGTLAALTGTLPPKVYAGFIDIPADLDPLRLEIELRNATGSLTASGLNLRAAVDNTVFTVARALCVVAALVLTAMTLAWLARSRRYAVLGTVALAGYFLLLVPPAWRAALLAVLPETGFLDISHMAIFTAVTVAVLWLEHRRQSRPMHVTLGLVTFAVATEALQYLVPGREPLFVDVLSNCLAIALVAVVAAALLRLLARRAAAE